MYKKRMVRNKDPRDAGRSGLGQVAEIKVNCRYIFMPNL